MATQLTESGAGKSVLSARLVEGLQALEGVVVLYFFFRNGDTSTTAPLEMAVSITSQLINSAGPADRLKLLRILKQVVHHGAPFADRGRNFKNVWKAFGDMLQSYSGSSRVIVVLDALDECGLPPIISAGVLQLQSSARFLVTGRPIVRELFEDKPNVSTIEMDVGEDISKFITEQVAEIKGLDRHKEAIIQTVNENSAGMFRYAGASHMQFVLNNSTDIPDKPLCWRSSRSIPGGAFQIVSRPCRKE
jgi:hypothetical protein